MNWFTAYSTSLIFLHNLYVIWTFLVALLYYPFVANPKPLQDRRTKVPINLALVLSSTREEPVTEEREAIIQSVISAVGWCKQAGVDGLSVYDRNGLVTRYAEQIKAALDYDAGRLVPECECSSDESDTDYPPTPPLTDFTDSRPISPEHWCSLPSVIKISLGCNVGQVRQLSVKHKQGGKSLQAIHSSRHSAMMTVSLVSYEASKPYLASIARTLAASAKATKSTIPNHFGELQINPESVDKIMRESQGVPAPDLTIVHSIKQHSLLCPLLELDGFQPWLLKLTEIYYDERPSLFRAWQNRSGKRNFVPLSEESFRRALDSYAQAEMRLGK